MEGIVWAEERAQLHAGFFCLGAGSVSKESGRGFEEGTLGTHTCFQPSGVSLTR